MERFVLLEACLPAKAAWSTAQINSGAPCVMTSGVNQMPGLSADNWDTPSSVSHEVCFQVSNASYIHSPFHLDATAFSNAFFGAGSGNIYLDNVACVGIEANLSSCTADLDTRDCTHSSDASVRCNPDCELYCNVSMLFFNTKFLFSFSFLQ